MQGIPGAPAPGAIWKDQDGNVIKVISVEVWNGSHTVYFLDDDGYVWQWRRGYGVTAATGASHYASTDCTGTAYMPLSLVEPPIGRLVIRNQETGKYFAVPDGPVTTSVLIQSWRGEGACYSANGSGAAFAIPNTTLTRPESPGVDAILHPE